MARDGFGERKTPRPFVNACDRFIDTESLTAEEMNNGAQPSLSSTRKMDRNELRSNTRLVSWLRTAAQSSAGEDDWALLSAIGSQVRKYASDFDPRRFGYKKLGDLVTATGLFEVQIRKGKSGQQQMYIRNNQVKKN